MTGFKSKKAAALDEDGMYLVHQTDHSSADKTYKTIIAGAKADGSWDKKYPAQEPVAWGVFEGNLHDMFFTEAEAVEMADLKGTHAEVKPLYTHPQRPWVDLTDNQIEQIYHDLVKIHRGAPMPWGQINFGKVLQAAIKEKNND